jgi:UDP-galactopyranose mutase
MSKKYDFVIVGAGMFGSVCARNLTDRGFKCLVIDKRVHIGGNCYTEKIEGINVHKYGPHIFHTSNKEVWDYVNKYIEFNHFVYRPKVMYDGKIYSFPLNLFTFYQIYGTKTPQEVYDKLQSLRIKNNNPQNLEEWILDRVGNEIYEIFIKGYTIKQWGRHPKNLPPSIIKRIPIRLTFNDNYYDDRHQGIPIGGYTLLFERLLEGIEVRLGVDYFDDIDGFDKVGDKIIYTGSLDRFYDFRFGELQYRSLEFETETIDIPDFQGNAAINYTNEEIPFTRIIEHKHFEFVERGTTVITREIPVEFNSSKDKLYPINDQGNTDIFIKYKKMANKEERVIFGGRLADYMYYDMDQVIGSALEKTRGLI